MMYDKAHYTEKKCWKNDKVPGVTINESAGQQVAAGH
jgi:hypothetical protein